MFVVVVSAHQPPPPPPHPDHPPPARQPLYADPIVTALDPGRAVQYRLYRQDTQYDGGRHVRDLSKLNRRMEHVLFVSGG